LPHTPGILILRADASIAIGTGHVMRCLSLAQAWQDAGGKAIFAMVAPPPRLRARLLSEKMELVELGAAFDGDADAGRLVELAHRHSATWVVIDGYHFGTQYQRHLKAAELRVLCVDDNGSAGHYAADVILNQNAGAAASLYADREDYTRLLLGSRYAMLRREFGAWRGWKRQIPSLGRKVLVTMGGSDPDNVTRQVIGALASLRAQAVEATVVIGGSNPHTDSLEQAAAGSGDAIRIRKDVSNMPELIAWADVAVSAAGSTCWEMCFLGLPAILIDLAENQRPTAEELSRKGCAVHLGSTASVSEEKIAEKLSWLLASAPTRRDISLRAAELVDGQGTARVISAMRAGNLHLRPATAEDCRLLWEWVNDPEVRAAAFSSAPIPWERHQAWFAAKMKDPDCRIFVAEDAENRPVGQFRVSVRSADNWEIDVSLARDFRRAGYGSLLIDLGARAAFAQTSGARLHAFVKPYNRASQSAFADAGFERLGEEDVDGHTAIHYLRTRTDKQA
jgi:UDP-2,4-diacetamido-2,4,6-trideoxy-beta-L-altropyranose hydrolase